MNWLDRIPFSVIVPAAALLALAPFSPEPHLWQKSKMLFSGNLTTPLDIFDLLFHAAPLVILSLKLARSRLSRG